MLFTLPVSGHNVMADQCIYTCTVCTLTVLSCLYVDTQYLTDGDSCQYKFIVGKGSNCTPRIWVHDFQGVLRHTDSETLEAGHTCRHGLLTQMLLFSLCDRSMWEV